jgi:hypothetical protein
MKVKTRIVFEVEYPLNLAFYDKDKEKALEMERALVALNPMEITEAFEARGMGTFETSVKMVGVANAKEEQSIKVLLRDGWNLEAIAHKLRLSVSIIREIAKKEIEDQERHEIETR